MKEECLGALKKENYDHLMDKCHDISIQILKDEVKRISPNTFVIYAKEKSDLEIICLSETGKREVREVPVKGFKKVSIEKNCMGKFNEEKLYSVMQLTCLLSKRVRYDAKLILFIYFETGNTFPRGNNHFGSLRMSIGIVYKMASIILVAKFETLLH